MLRVAPLWCALGCLVLLLPAAIGAVPGDRPVQAPPLADIPAEPAAPPLTPREGAPPVLELTLPSPPRPEVPGPSPVASGAGAHVKLLLPPGPPDLLAIVRLPTAVDPFPGRGARPFGGSPPASSGQPSFVTPEPATALLMSLGLFGLARLGRRRA
ncbi:MAG TPA: PEP-CTERM sorting domain-containing protein [Myxococcota bacterium]